MNPLRLFPALVAAFTALAAWGTDGSRVPMDDLRDMLEELRPAAPEVREVVVEREVVREVVREVEVPARASQTVSFGGSMDAQGCAHPGGVDSTYTMHLAYSYELEGFRFRGSVMDKPRGSDCTAQGLTIDLAGTQMFNFVGGSFLDIDIGYDEHGVTGFDADNRLVFGAVKQATGAAMIAYAIDSLLPGALRVKVGWNIANGEPRFAASYDLGEYVEVQGDCTGTGGDDPYCDAAVAWRRSFGDDWGVEVRFEHSNGFEFLPDPFGGRADAPAANEVNSLVFAMTRVL